MIAPGTDAKRMSIGANGLSVASTTMKETALITELMTEKVADRMPIGRTPASRFAFSSFS